CVPSPACGRGIGRGDARRVARVAPSPPLPRKREGAQTERPREERAVTPPGKPHLLALLEHVVEARKRGAGGGGGGAPRRHAGRGWRRWRRARQQGACASPAYARPG